MMKKLVALFLLALFVLVPAAQASVAVELTSPEQYYGENRLFCWVSMPEKRGSGLDEIHITRVSANIAIQNEDVHGDVMFITNFLYLYDPVGQEHFELGLWHWGGVDASDIWLYFETSRGPGQYTKTFIGPAERNHSYCCVLIAEDEGTGLQALVDGVVVAEFDFSHLNNRIWRMEFESTWVYNVAGSIAAGTIMEFSFYQDGWKTGITNWSHFDTYIEYPYGMILYYCDVTYTFLDGIRFRGGFDYGVGGGGGAVCYHK